MQRTRTAICCRLVQLTSTAPLSVASRSSSSGSFGCGEGFIVFPCFPYSSLFCVARRLQSQQATLASFAATFFEAFNVPVRVWVAALGVLAHLLTFPPPPAHPSQVFWPILVFYFIVLFVLSMKKQIRVRLPIGLCDFNSIYASNSH